MKAFWIVLSVLLGLISVYLLLGGIPIWADYGFGLGPFEALLILSALGCAASVVMGATTRRHTRQDVSKDV